MKKPFTKIVLYLTLTCVIVSSAFYSGCGLIEIIPANYTNSFTDESGATKYLLTDVDKTELLIGMTQEVSATVSDSPDAGDFSKLIKVEWQSENSGIATVDENGIITAVSLGKTNVFASLSEKVKKAVEVKVVEKELTGIEIFNAKTTFILNSEYKANFTCQATFNGKFTETVEPTMIDSSAVKPASEGDYDVKVYYTYGNKTAVAHYTVSFRAEFNYKSEYLKYNYKDIYENSVYANIRTAFCPSEGTINYLVIPVRFTDYNLNETTAKQNIEKAFFGESKSNGWNSVKTFYETASNGKLEINGKVSEWYKPLTATTVYGNDAAAINALAENAVEWYFAQNPSENRADYDYDNNGTLDSVAIIYGCPDSSEEWGKNLPNFWGKVIRPEYIEGPDVSSPTLGFFMWASYSDVNTDTFPGRNSVDSHVYIHETGHLFGLEDYYDYGPNKFSPAGGFITMEYNTGGQDPFSCLALGWAKAVVPLTSCTIDLKDFQNGHEVIVLSSTPDAFESPFDEYIIIELYAPTGLNKFDATYTWRHSDVYKGALTAGIRIWHVDARLIKATVSSGVVSWSADEFYTDPTVGKTDTAFTNSWEIDGRISALGAAYKDYSLLFAVRNNKETTFTPDRGSNFSADTMFYAGDTFDVPAYSSQFVNGTKLNGGGDLGWSVGIEKISGNAIVGYTAKINLTFAD